MDPDGEYGRGTGWTDGQWRRFNNIQQSAADKMEKTAEKLEDKANKLDEKGKAGGDALRGKAQSLRGGVTALRSDGTEATGGYVANAVSDLTKPHVGASVPRNDRTTVNVNLANPIWASNNMQSQWAVGHESLHSTAGGVFGHQLGPNSEKAYKFGTRKQRKAYNALKGTPQADKNPDHLMDEVY